MRVALNGWFWNTPTAGSGTYVRALLAALPGAAPDAAFALVLPHGVPAERVPPNVTVLRAGRAGGLLAKADFELRAFPAAAGAWRADLLHVPYWGPPLSAPAKLIVSVLDVIPLLDAAYNQGLARRLVTSLAVAGVQGAAHLLTLSAAAKADVVAQLNVPPERVSVTHLAPGPQFHPQIGRERDAAVAARYALPDDFVLYLGSYDTRKRVEQLLAAATYLQRAYGEALPVVLAGATPPRPRPPLYPDLHARAAALGLDDATLRWLGPVDAADQPSLYRLARVFVFPSRYEGFGLPLVEAMACGTPVVANDIPVFAEVVGEGAYLVPDGDSTKMAGAIIALHEQNPLRDSLINAGLGVATRYSWRKTARATVAAYQQALATS